MVNNFTAEEDHLLMDAVVLYNPFQRGHSWAGLWQQERNPTLLKRKAKTLRDRALRLMESRHIEVTTQEKASGIEEPPRNDLQIACDEALLLQSEAKEEGAPKKRGCETSNCKADASILQAAESTLPKQAAESCCTGDASSSTSTTPPPPKRRASSDLVTVLKAKVAEEKARREEKQKEEQRKEEASRAQQEERERQRREEFMLVRADAEEDRKLKREEMELRRQELELRKQQEADSSKERQLMLQVLMQQLNK